MLIVDAHQDLAWNMLTFRRDYTRPAAETRRQEQRAGFPDFNGDTLLGWPDYQRGRVAVIFSTLFVSPVSARVNSAWDTQFYTTANEAHAFYRAQLEAYYRLVEEAPDKFRLVLNRSDLESVLACWEANPRPLELSEDAAAEAAERRAGGAAKTSPDGPEEDPSAMPQGNPVGLVMLMEGAEGVRSPGELEEWWQWGVRIVGPAWAGNRYTGGTNQPGPLTSEGFALLEAMGSLGFNLDLSHMDEKAVLQALDVYPGQVLASHANCLALLKDAPTNRHISDRVIAGILERDGVIGAVPYNTYLKVGWRKGDSRTAASLQDVVAHIDHICQMAGDASHAALGSDFDGGFGLQSTPYELDTIADLRKLIPLLEEKGYSEEDIAAILGGNWLDLLKRTLPG